MRAATAVLLLRLGGRRATGSCCSTGWRGSSLPPSSVAFCTHRSRRHLSSMKIASGGTGNGSEIAWRDDLSVPCSSPAVVADCGSRNFHGDEFSILSWNVLSQTSEQANEPYSYRGIELVPPRPWEHRVPQILRTVRTTDADVVCLQEVSADTFLADLLPPLEADGGYVGLVQKGKGRYPAVATLWKSDRFTLDASSHRSRTMTAVLREVGSGHKLAVVNCHLEGHPHKSFARVTQMHHALRDTSAKYSHHGLVVCGDFNCEVHSSALSAYLGWGSVPRNSGILEWGRSVPAEAAEVPSHQYNLTSAYPPELTREHPFNFFTYCRLPGRPGAGLDQAWYTDGPLARVALRRLFSSDEQRVAVLERGIPSEGWPSDHVPIGCVLRWRASGSKGKEMEDLRLSSQTQSDNTNRTAAEVLAEASELLAACPFSSDEERREFDYVTSNVPGLPEKGKPSPEQIAQLADRRIRRDKLLASATDEAQQILQRVLKLRKEALKLKQ
mmetsp:Transcript_29356/g.86985  ORF Transcript_29356/g.86985 Transcript_29356/m.86985 type:complete len:499 (-) Transcript_29356:38-1534(-)